MTDTQTDATPDTKELPGILSAGPVVTAALALLGVVFAVLTFSGVLSPTTGLIATGVALLGSAVLALLGWSAERQRTSRLDERAEDLLRERDDVASELRVADEERRRSESRMHSVQSGEKDLQEELDRLKQKAREQERAIGRERYLRARSQEAYQSMQTWSGELQRELLSLGRKDKSSDTDLPTMILRLATTVLEARKGIILSRDGDGDTSLRVSAHEGFEEDPTESSLVRRFAKIGLERDSTVREENPTDGDDSSPADAEIENLVAIPIYVMGEFDGVVVCANRDGGFDDFEDAVLLSIGEQAGVAFETVRSHGEARQTFTVAMGMISEALEAKDPFTRGHSVDLPSLAERAARNMGFDDEAVERVRLATLLRDVGKIAISERVLLKPGPLDFYERSIVETHPLIGARMISRIPSMEETARVVLMHHERPDGTGYPERRSGDAIPPESKIVAVADAFCAMTTARPYRIVPMTAEAACRELENGSGTQFDRDTVRAFVSEVEHGTEDLKPRNTLSEALNDPGLHLIRKGKEPLLGHQPGPRPADPGPGTTDL